MSDHNFEKQIQQKLDELKIPPADSVWSAVQQRIRNDKSRRRRLILFPLVLVLLGAGSYFIFSDNFSGKNNTAKLSSSDSKTQPNNSTTNDVNGSKADPIRNNKRIDSGDIRQERFQAAVRQETVKEKNIRSNIKERKSIFKSSHQNDQVLEDKKLISGNSERLEKYLNEKPTIESTGSRNVVPDQLTVNHTGTDKRQQTSNNRHKENDNNRVGNDIISPLNDSLADQITAGNVTVNPQTADSLSELPVAKMIDSALTDINTSSKKALENKYNRKKLKWGVEASAGISNINKGSLLSGVFSGHNALVADVAENRFTVPNSNASAPVVYKSSPVEKGFSFSAGAFLHRDISRRFSIVTGLRYNYASNHNQVGRRVDSSVTVQNTSGSMKLNQYYRSAGTTKTTKYTNRYHFVELPLTLHVQLNNSNRLAVLWNGGLSLSYLVSTNALHFDSRTGIYYRDNSLFNKLQASFSTGFSVSMFSKSSMPVHIGPQVQYGLTNLLQKEISDSRHLLYFGLNTRFYLKK